LIAQGLDYEWCKAPDAGLLAPDLVLFLDVDAATAAQRGGYGDERYEEPELQKRVRTAFARLAADPGAPEWTTIDASQTMDAVSSAILSRVLAIVDALPAAVPTPLWSS
jgi:dTMP kinase